MRDGEDEPRDQEGTGEVGGGGLPEQGWAGSPASFGPWNSTTFRAECHKSMVKT